VENLKLDSGHRVRASIALVLCATLILLMLPAKIARADDREREGDATTARGGDGPRVEDDSSRSETKHTTYPRIITDWNEGEPIPHGYRPTQRTHRGPIIAGSVTFGTLYFFSLLAAAAGTDAAKNNGGSNDVAWLYAPAVGPFLALTQSPSAVGNMFLIIDGLGQVAGLTLLIWGLTSPMTVLIRDDAAGPRLIPTPMLLGKDGGGVGIVGTF
jgi:hypothetical protein